MSRILLILLILSIIITGYFFLPPTEQKSKEAANIPTAKQPLQVSSLTDEERSKGLTHIKNLTEHENVSIDASTASHFVTEDQLIKLPDTKDASISLNQKNDTNSSNGAQTFGVEITAFNRKNNSVTDMHDSTTTTANRIRIGTQIKLKELLDQSDSNDKRIFYIHAVNQNDQQGLWGILQSGLTNTFAKGITLSANNKLIQATIPQEADEKLTNEQSSFLGKLLHDKVTTTHIYNFQQGLLGQNPDLITPGQQLIIVSFSEDELLNIYQHYSQQGRNQ